MERTGRSSCQNDGRGLTTDDENPLMKIKMLMMMMRKMMIHLCEQVSGRSRGGQLLPLSKPKAGTACLARSLNVEILKLENLVQSTSSSINLYQLRQKIPQPIIIRSIFTQPTFSQPIFIKLCSINKTICHLIINQVWRRSVVPRNCDQPESKIRPRPSSLCRLW